MLLLLDGSYRLADELAQSASLMVGVLLVARRASPSRRDHPRERIIKTERQQDGLGAVTPSTHSRPVEPHADEVADVSLDDTAADGSVRKSVFLD